MTTINPKGFKKTAKAMGVIADRIRHPEPVNRFFGERMLAETDQRFENEQGPTGKWKALDPLYQASKIRQRKRREILQRNGDLRQTIDYFASDDEFALGSNREYAPYVQAEREFLYYTDDDIDAYGDAWEAWLENGVPR